MVPLSRKCISERKARDRVERAQRVRPPLRRWQVALTLALILPTNSEALGDSAGASATPDPAWCAEGLETVVHSSCYYHPPAEEPVTTLVIFLHGVIQPDTSWQHAQQSSLVRAARRNGFALLAPRGRRGHGPQGMTDWWTWPTSVRAQGAVEDELLEEWTEARAHIEQRREKPFDRVLLFGFSNGAYYGSQLALRGRFPTDGYAVFAGGTGADWLERHAKDVKRRPPIFVGYGLKDEAARRDAPALVRLLRRLGWRHKSSARPASGHTMPDAELDRAFGYLTRDER